MFRPSDFQVKCVGRTRFCALLPSDVSALFGCVRNSDVVAAKFTAMRHTATSSSLATTSLRRSNFTEEHARNTAAGSSSLAGRLWSRRRRLRRHPEDVDTQTKTLYCESMAIPGGLVVDPERLADVFLVQPFEYGADVIVCSTTVVLDGHGPSLNLNLLMEALSLPTTQRVSIGCGSSGC